jgi:hypothetical protein
LRPESPLRQSRDQTAHVDGDSAINKGYSNESCTAYPRAS